MAKPNKIYQEKRHELYDFLVAGGFNLEENQEALAITLKKYVALITEGQKNQIKNLNSLIENIKEVPSNRPKKITKNEIKVFKRVSLERRKVDTSHIKPSFFIK